MTFSSVIYRCISRDTKGIFRQIPLRTRGKLFVSPMPFGAYDTGNRVLGLYRQNRVGHVFILATDDEITRKARRDLRREYEKIGAGSTQFPIVDMTAPDLTTLRNVVADAVRKLSSINVAVHCHAGVGRTSIFVCCVAQAVEKLSAENSLAYVKTCMEVNMTTEQKNMVVKFGSHVEQAGLIET
ncbi:MAG TPA: protein-tyrosine phosphatase family protein [Kiritimatiellia bacterium]|nr:protein-tyrosine phosphatase family protein [Kiritimatiellia bacterium]